VGKRATRLAPGACEAVGGVVVAYLPADGDDEELWHFIHDDGDDEDLSLDEVCQIFSHNDGLSRGGYNGDEIGNEPGKVRIRAPELLESVKQQQQAAATDVIARAEASHQQISGYEKQRLENIERNPSAHADRDAEAEPEAAAVPPSKPRRRSLEKASEKASAEKASAEKASEDAFSARSRKPAAPPQGQAQAQTPTESPTWAVSFVRAAASLLPPRQSLTCFATVVVPPFLRRCAVSY
jgi:hypothetical protein